MVAQASILRALEARPMSTVDIAEAVGTTPSDVSSSIPQLLKYDLIRVVGWTAVPHHSCIKVYALDDWHGPMQRADGRVSLSYIPKIRYAVGMTLRLAQGPMTLRQIAGSVHHRDPVRVTNSQLVYIGRILRSMESEGKVRRTREQVGALNHPADLWELVA